MKCVAGVVGKVIVVDDDDGTGASVWLLGHNFLIESAVEFLLGQKRC